MILQRVWRHAVGEDGKRSNWDLITGTLSKCYPVEESGICDWNYLSKLDTFLRCFHTSELFRKITARRSLKGLHWVLKDARNCREVGTKRRTEHSLLEKIAT